MVSNDTNPPLLKPGKLNIIIDGQFGSTGKGLVASYLGFHNHVDIAITNASTNAGHTFYLDGKKHVTKHLPVSGVLNKRSTIYLCAGSIIDPEYLAKEMCEFDIDPDRMRIHPRAAVIETVDKQKEATGSVKKIASTQSGVGAALQRKIDRSAKLAKDHPFLAPMVGEIDLNYYLDQDAIALMEVPQGFDLSINSGLSYPHCTSREITVSAAMADAQVHPRYLGSVIVVIRTFPIRVGHIMEEGKVVGDSGPFYPDSRELTWKELKQPEEYTTNTKRVRRIATFSMQQYRRMVANLKPDYVFLNFCNYLTRRPLEKLIKQLAGLTHVCFGPEITDVRELYNPKWRNDEPNPCQIQKHHGKTSAIQKHHKRKEGPGPRKDTDLQTAAAV